MTTYSVHVEVGNYSWDVTGNDTDGDLPAAYGLADPLVISHAWPQSDLRPNVQPDAREATVTIIAPNSTTYVLSVGDAVAVEFYSQAGFTGNGATFYGRIVGMTANPHDLGVIYSLSCADYTVDLQEQNTVGLVAYPAERVSDRLNRIFDEALIPRVQNMPPIGTLGDYQSVGARAIAPTTPYQAILELLAQWAVLPDTDELGVAVGTPGLKHQLPVLVPRIANRRLATDFPYQLTWVTTGRRVSWTPPLRLASVGGLLTVTTGTAYSSPATFSWVLDAGKINIGSTFTQQKGGGSLSKVSVTTLVGSHQYDWSRVFNFWQPVAVPPVSAIIDTQLTNTPTATDSSGGQLEQVYRLGYRPEVQLEWSVGTLEWEAWAEAANWAMPALGDLVTVARVLAAKAPNSREWVAGVLAGWKLTVSGGRPTVDLDLDAPTNNPADNAFQLGHTNGVCCFDSPQIGGWLFSQFAVRDTFIDYRLVRGTA